MDIFKKSLDKIVKSFQTTLDELDLLLTQNTNEVIKKNDEIAVLEASVALLANESDRARVIRSNIAKLLEV